MVPLRRSLPLLIGLTACLADAPDAPAPTALVLRACDALGRPAPLTALPRQPRLALELAGLDAPDGAPWLFSGAMDDALARDLARLPLTAASAERLVPTRRTRNGRDLVLTPRAPLRAAGEYSFALPASALPVAQQPPDMQKHWSVALHVDASAQAGASLRASFPGPGASGVSPQLARAVVSFDGEVQGSEDGIWLEDASGLAVPGSAERLPCAELDSAAVSCIGWTPHGPLAPDAHYSLRSGRALRDAHGAEISELRADLTTLAPDSAPPESWLHSPCAPDELALDAGCALAQDDRLLLRLFPGPGVRVVVALGATRIAALPRAEGVRVELPDLTADSPQRVVITALDTEQRERVLARELRTTPELATLTISEVYADPSGKEPDQEFVELWNFGPHPVPLTGLTLADESAASGTRIDSDVSLAPGARALLVGAAFDLDSALDPPLQAGTPLVRVPKTLTAGGLSNRGEALYLRDAAGHRLSAVPERPSPRPGQCLVRIGTDPRSGEPESFGFPAQGGCTPGS